jgi:hypothetical protein
MTIDFTEVADYAQFRQLCFNIQSQQTPRFLPSDFEKYWPYVSHVWTLERGRKRSSTGWIEYYFCRLKNKKNRDMELAQGPSRQRRTVYVEGLCSNKVCELFMTCMSPISNALRQH